MVTAVTTTVSKGAAMKKTRTGSPAGEAFASPPVATVQLPLRLLDVLADTRTAFFGLCLDAGQQVLGTMMERDRRGCADRRTSPIPIAAPTAVGVSTAKSRSGAAASPC